MYKEEFDRMLFFVCCVLYGYIIYIVQCMLIFNELDRLESREILFFIDFKMVDGYC